jgi:uncharacterized protein YjbI with pentapeptide repeats
MYNEYTPLIKSHKSHNIGKMGFPSLLFSLILISFLLAIPNQEANGLIEIKKYKTINSKDVCGDKLCSAISEQKAKKGSSLRSVEICGDAPCDAKNKTSKQSDTGKGSAIKIESFSLNERNFLLFKGTGWHNLHNVEIKITGQTFETLIRSQTNDRGNLYMPWPIPKTFVDGTYNISATDGIRSAKFSVEIKVSDGVSVNTSRADKCSSTKTPIDWSGCDLYGKILTNVDLRNAKLKGANLYGASLQNKDLSGADLSNAVLKRANLDGAIIIGANLSHSNMIDAKIREADLSNAKMRSANLYRADFSKSNLSNVDFAGATLSYANLSFTNLNGANLENAGTWATNLNHCKNHPICER